MLFTSNAWLPICSQVQTQSFMVSTATTTDCTISLPIFLPEVECWKGYLRSVRNRSCLRSPYLKNCHSKLVLPFHWPPRSWVSFYHALWIAVSFDRESRMKLLCLFTAQPEASPNSKQPKALTGVFNDWRFRNMCLPPVNYSVAWTQTQRYCCFLYLSINHFVMV